MRCLFVVPSLNRAGAETQVVALVNGMAARGHEVHLLTFESLLPLAERLDERVRHHAAMRRYKFDFSYTREIARIIDEFRIEVVHTTLQFALLAAWLGRLRSRSRPPLVASLHTTISRNTKEEWQNRLLYRHLLRRCARVIFVSANQRDYWLERYPGLGNHSVVIHNGVAVERFRKQDFEEAGRRLREKHGIPEDAVVFSCIAAFRPEKGHHLLLAAFDRLERDAWLLLAGDGESRPEIGNLAARSRKAERILFLGQVADTRPVIAASQATVLSSVAVETFSMAMLESMALEVPMIAPAIGGLPEAIEPGHSGWLFPVGDGEGLAMAMRGIADDPKQAQRMGEAARQTVIERFSESGMIERTAQLLQEVVEDNASVG